MAKKSEVLVLKSELAKAKRAAATQMRKDEKRIAELTALVAAHEQRAANMGIVAHD